MVSNVVPIVLMLLLLTTQMTKSFAVWIPNVWRKPAGELSYGNLYIFYILRVIRNAFRLCKESNHIPLRCDEVEKGVELEMRKFIEEHVTEAMIRKCPRCTQVIDTLVYGNMITTQICFFFFQRFYKVEGCNKMTCSSCGLFICYVCRETINGYDHFTNNERYANEHFGCRRRHCYAFRCTLSNQSEKLHYEEMVQAYANAKNEYLRLHPEAHDMVLRYDPISHLTKPATSATSATWFQISNFSSSIDIPFVDQSTINMFLVSGSLSLSLLLIMFRFAFLFSSS